MNSLVSVIISTKNEERNIKNILEGLESQTYKNIELIVVDNNSSDKTKEIAKKYTDKVFEINDYFKTLKLDNLKTEIKPERSSQRNLGAKKAKGDYLLFLDADMILGDKVVEECLKVFSKKKGTVGLIIPEISIGKGFWAECKALEKSFYLGINWIEAARFFQRKIFERVGGYDENLISGEDWDLSQRVAKSGEIGRIKESLHHNEGEISLTKTVKKKFYYSKHLAKYSAKEANRQSSNEQLNILARYNLFFSNPKKLFRNPSVGLGMLFMKTCEFGFAGLGYLVSRIKKT